MTGIGYRAFYNYSALTSVVIPDSVTVIERYAFQNCADLASIVFEGLVCDWDLVSKGSGWKSGTSAAVTCTGPAYPKNAVAYNGHYYMVIPKTLTWAEAKALCEAYGGHLATISHAGEQAFVADLVQNYNYACWLGAFLDGDKWGWVNGEALVYSHWDEGEPSYDSIVDSGEGFVGMYANNTETVYATASKWNDFSSTRTLGGFVCEWEPAADPDANRTLIGISTADAENRLCPGNNQVLIAGINKDIYDFRINENGEVIYILQNGGLGTLYYLDENGNRVTVGDAELLMLVGDRAMYGVNWNTAALAAGSYTVVFVQPTSAFGDEIELYSTVTVVKTVPETIRNVTAVPDFDTIQLSWSQSTEVATNNYYIYRRAAGEEAFSLIKVILDRKTLTYADHNVVKDVTYEYYVVAIDNLGTRSEPSSVASSALLHDVEAPTVTKLEPAVGSRINATVSFRVTAVDNRNVAQTLVYYSTDDGETWELIGTYAGVAGVIPWDSTQVPDGVVHIKAVAKDQAGNESVPKTVTYWVDNTGPKQVVGLTALSVESSIINLKWSDVDAADAKCFILQMRQEGRFVIVSSNITTLGYTLKALSSDTTYTFRVAAVDMLGNIGAYSEPFTVTTKKDVEPPVITAQGPKPARYNSSIPFTVTVEDDSRIQTIAIQFSRDCVNWTTVYTKQVEKGFYSVSYTYSFSLDGHADGSIFLRAIATDEGGNLSDQSDKAPYVEYYIDKTAPAAPEGLTAAGGDGWIHLKWDLGTENDLASYTVCRSTAVGGVYTVIARNVMTSMLYDRSAQHGTEYFYKVRAVDSCGNVSEYSVAVSAKADADKQPPIVVSVFPTNGSYIGSEYKTVQVLVSDNHLVDRVVVEYSLNGGGYVTLIDQSNLNDYSVQKSANLPISEWNHGDVIQIRVWAVDKAGYISTQNNEYVYSMDTQAPDVQNPTATLNGNDVTILWYDGYEDDLAGFLIYRIMEDGTRQSIASRQNNSTHTYSVTDHLSSLGSGIYRYEIVSLDKVGNRFTFTTNEVDYQQSLTNQVPQAVIQCLPTMEEGVEEIFDASASKDDKAIISYEWDFGDGTGSNAATPVKKYAVAGTYTVTLTVTDAEGESSTATAEVEVLTRTAMGEICVKVVDENNRPVSNAPVYFDLGSDTQTVFVTDSQGMVRMTMKKGDHLIGVYKNNYLPVQKKVTVLPNATRTVTMTIIEEELVTGTFEVTRMTFDEIVAAGIDVNDPANQNVFSVTVRVAFGSRAYDVSYIRNDRTLIKSQMTEVRDGDSGGGSSGNNNYGGGSVGSGKSYSLTWIPNSQGAEILAIIELSVSGTVLKEFFDVKLHIVNNASEEFVLINNEVTLVVPEGMTMMTGLTGDWFESPVVQIGSIRGQEQKTIGWILRGDKPGSYDLTAYFTGTLDVFDVPINATFETDEPIRVYGMENLTFNVEVNETIEYNAFYFNIGLENSGSVDIHCPMLDYVQMVNSTMYRVWNYMGMDFYVAVEQLEADVMLYNVRYQFADGSFQYIPYNTNDIGQITTGVKTLAPGETLFFEFVAYNAVHMDTIGYFYEELTRELNRFETQVNVYSVDMDMYSLDYAKDKYEYVKENRLDELILKYENDYFYNIIADSTVNDAGQFVYWVGDLAFNLDLGFTDDYELARDMVTAMVLDETVMDNIDQSVNEVYFDAALAILDLIAKSLRANFSDSAKVIDILRNIHGSGGDIQTIATALRHGGDTAAKETIFNTLSSYLLAAGIQISMHQLKTHIDGVDFSPAWKEVSNKLYIAGWILDAVVVSGAKAWNNATQAQFVYSIIQAEKCHDEMMFLLDTLIESDLPVTMPAFSSAIKEVASEYKKALENNASSWINDFFEQWLVLGGVTSVESTAKVVRLMLQNAGKINVMYYYLGLGFIVLDQVFKWGERAQSIDEIELIAALTEVFADKYRENNQDSAENKLRALKYVLKMRLKGEQLFKVHMEKFDKDFVEGYNKKYDTEYDSLDEMHDEMNEHLIYIRDAIFKTIRNAQEADRPNPPSIWYDPLNSTITLKQYGLEYCLGDGEWKDVDGLVLPIRHKKVQQVLRIRVKSAAGSPAGKITTVLLYAQPELSKLITVRYDNGEYTFTHLDPNESYGIYVVDSVYDSFDISKLIYFKGADAKVSAPQGKYVYLQSCLNITEMKAPSVPALLTPQVKTPLTVNIWGQGTVKQPNADGRYFVGDTVSLTAEPMDGSIFVGWYANETLISRDQTYLLEMYEYADITARFDGGSVIEANAVSIELVKAEKLYDTSSLQQGFLTVFSNSQVKLKANILPQLAGVGSVVWTSSDESVATVDQTGLVTAVGAGSAVITVTVNNKHSATFRMSVVDNRVVSVRIIQLPHILSYYWDEKLNTDGLRLIATYLDGTEAEVFRYDILNYTYPMGYGTHTITVSYQGVTADFDIEIKKIMTIGQVYLEAITDVSFVFTAHGAPNREDVKLELMYAGKKMTIQGVEYAPGQYRFKTAGVPPQYLSRSILAMLYVNGNHTDMSLPFSFEYLLRDLTSIYSEDETICKWIGTMLKYCEAAQAVYGGETITLLPDSYTEHGWFDEVPEESDLFIDKSIYYSPDGTRFYGASVFYDGENRLCFVIQTPDISRVSIRLFDGEKNTWYYEDDFVYEDGLYKIYSAPISAMDYSTVYQVDLFDGANLIQILDYSVNSYVYSLINNKKYSKKTRDMVKALYNYGVACEALVAEHGGAFIELRDLSQRTNKP